MYQLNTPKFRFGLFLVEQNKFKNNNQNNQSGQPTICFADTYEIKEDGSIIFYQTGTSPSDNKRFKIPVVAYPNGKWEACVLLDDNNQFPVFSGNGSFKDDPFKTSPDSSHVNMNVTSTTKENNYRESSYREPTREKESPSPFAETNTNKNNLPLKDDSEDDLDSLSGLLGDENSVNHSNNNSHTPTPNNNWSRTGHNNTNNANNGNNYNPAMNNNPNSGNNFNNNMPGVAQNGNADEFKKAKNALLETSLKEYTKNHLQSGQFNISAFQTFLSKDPKAKPFRITETDIVWAASNLIRERMLLARKFSEPLIQKTLELNLPDIMKRQWSGKMGPIILVLQEREETKNVNAIDLAVWMVKNGFD